jgi:hypothetical protein
MCALSWDGNLNALQHPGSSNLKPEFSFYHSSTFTLEERHITYDTGILENTTVHHVLELNKPIGLIVRITEHYQTLNIARRGGGAVSLVGMCHGLGMHRSTALEHLLVVHAGQRQSWRSALA